MRTVHTALERNAIPSHTQDIVATGIFTDRRRLPSQPSVTNETGSNATGVDVHFSIVVDTASAGSDEPTLFETIKTDLDDSVTSGQLVTTRHRLKLLCSYDFVDGDVRWTSRNARRYEAWSRKYCNALTVSQNSAIPSSAPSRGYSLGCSASAEA